MTSWALVVSHLFSKVVYFYNDKEMVATEQPYDYFNPLVSPAHHSIFMAPLPDFSDELLLNWAVAGQILGKKMGFWDAR